ncbi:MAG: CopG family transcriptional regulator [Pseudanabaena sp.]|nr:MAG: CopG family transcriptional regulator [Pseudanabaena sp.]
MQSQKISISLPPQMLAFLDHYQKATGSPSRSQVISKALSLLQSQELEQAYREASLEVDETWEIAIGDGLGDETW